MEQLNEKLECIVGQIRKIKRLRGIYHKAYNDHLFRSLISQQRGIGGSVRYTVYPDPDEDIAMAKSCKTLDEWRGKFIGRCALRDTKSHQDFVTGIVEDKEFHTPDCDCSYYYSYLGGGDSMFLVFEYERNLKELEEQLRRRENQYRLVLRRIKHLQVGGGELR